MCDAELPSSERACNRDLIVTREDFILANKDIEELVGSIIYREAIPSDMHSLQTMHREMFPVDYEESFFERVVHRQDGLENLTAVSRDSSGNEALIGFVTARVFRLWECDPVDRAYLGLNDRLLDHETVFYILTLAVSPPFRKRGVGARLVRWVVSHARQTHCRAAYLHVIQYNLAAIALYSGQQFEEAACRENFYYITSGRQPNPKQQIYDAYLYAYVLDASVDRGLLSYVFLAMMPFRSIIGHLRQCLPWDQPVGSYFGGGELPSLEPSQESGGNCGAGHGCVGQKEIPPWLTSLFSRQKLLRRQ